MKQDAYEKFAEKALTYLEGTEAFLKEQLPDYFQQVVTYYAVEAWIVTAVGIGLFIIAIICGRTCYKEGSKGVCDMDDSKFILSMIVGLFTLVFGIGLAASKFPTALKATIAPKVFIVDYLRGKE